MLKRFDMRTLPRHLIPVTQKFLQTTLATRTHSKEYIKRLRSLSSHVPPRHVIQNSIAAPPLIKSQILVVGRKEISDHQSWLKKSRKIECGLFTEQSMAVLSTKKPLNLWLDETAVSSTFVGSRHKGVSGHQASDLKGKYNPRSECHSSISSSNTSIDE